MRALGSPVNSDYDLDNSGAGAAVYSATPDAATPRWLSFDIAVGDASKDLDGTGGDFTLNVTIGGVIFDGAAQTKTVAASTTRLRFQSLPLLVPANAAVELTLISPNAADSDVDVTVQPYDVAPLQPATAGRTLGVESDGDLTKVNALHGHTAQTGDSYARLGAPDGDSIAADILTRLASTSYTAPDNAGISENQTDLDAIISAIAALNDYDGSDTSGVTALLARLTTTRAGYLDNLSAGVVPTAAQNAVAVEAAILDEGDATALLSAIAAKVEEFLVNEGDETATLAAVTAAIRVELATELARIDANISSRGTADPGDQMDLVSSPNATAVTAIQNGLATATALAAAQTDLDTVTDDGVALATTQPNYAPAKAGDAMTLADGAITAAKIADGALTAAKFAAGAFNAVWTVATRVLTAGTNIVLAKGTGITGLNDPAASAIRSEMDSTSTQLAKVATIYADMTQDNGGTRQFTIAALENGPAGEGGSASAIADAVLDELLAGHTTEGSLSEALTLIRNLLEAEITVDTSVTPWAMVWKQKGTSTELLRKKLKDVSGSSITATTTAIGQAVK